MIEGNRVECQVHPRLDASVFSYTTGMHLNACSGLDKSSAVGDCDEIWYDTGSGRREVLETANASSISHGSECRLVHRLEGLDISQAATQEGTCMSDQQELQDSDVYQETCCTVTSNSNMEMDISAFSQDNDGDTALHIEIILEHEQTVMALIASCPTLQCLNIQNRLFQTALHLAVHTKQLRTVRRLVVAGADVELRDRQGNTPLHIACRMGSVPLVKALLSPMKYTETRHRWFESSVRVPQNLELHNYDGLTCFHLAGLQGHTEVMSILEQNGTDVNAGEMKSGRTMLHMAAWMGNLDIVTYLLNLPHCNPNAHAYDTSTPFDLARSNGYFEVLEKLAEHGANCYVDDSDSEDEY